MTKTDFEAVVHEHQGRVYSIALNFFHNPAIAEEIAQDVFLQLFENRRKVDTGHHCVAWLRLSTIHRCIDTLRRASFRQEILVDVFPEVPVEVQDTDPLLHDALQRWVASLPEKPRAVMVLRFGEDMDVGDIAEALKMPERTVWSHLQRATAMLREKASRYGMEKEHEPSRTRST